MSTHPEMTNEERERRNTELEAESRMRYRHRRLFQGDVSDDELWHADHRWLNSFGCDNGDRAEDTERRIADDAGAAFYVDDGA